MASEQLIQRIADDPNDWDQIDRGEFAISPDRGFFVFWRSADDCPVCIPIAPKNVPGQAWGISGHDAAPTIEPSIWVNKPTGWHGWIRDGRADDA